MKAFRETWTNRNKNQGGFGMKWLGEEFWRAALEQVRDIDKENNIMDSHAILDEIRNWIKQELEEK